MQEKRQKISPIKQRILQFAEYLCISKRDFYSKIGVSRGTLESATGITEDVVAKFITTYPQVSINWLMLGEGEMLKSDFSVEDRKNEHQDKKKCHDAQNNFSEKNVTPLIEFHDKKNVTPIEENVTPICNPNSEDEPQRPFFSMASEECDPYQKIDTPIEHKREQTEGVKTEQIIELKDHIIDTQKSYISSLEAQISDLRRNNEMLRCDVFDLKKDLKELKKENKELNNGIQQYEECVNYEAIDEAKKRPKDSAPVSVVVVAQPKQ